jgi:sterol O-acyltransferase
MPKITHKDLITEMRRFNYFLWVPTLVYRDDYVMRPKMDKSNFFKNLLTFNLCVYYTFAMIKGFLHPTFVKFFQNDATFEDIFTIATCVGILFLTMAFFGILHSWMNMFAEITRFGDRQFYTDWWNVSNYGAYYRKWNIIVHEWLYYYVYNDSVRFSLGNIGSTGAKMLVFGISAIIHEVIMLCSLKFFFPILLILFGGPGVIFMSMTKSNNRILGIGFWFTMIIGNGILISLYSMEFYTRLQPEYQQVVSQGGITVFFKPFCYDYFMKRYLI